LKKAVILPESQSWETCLKEAKAASYGSAAYSALVPYCSEYSSDAASVDWHINSVLKSLSYLAYDHDYRGFTNRRLAANVDLVTTLEKNAAYIFADNYLVAGIRGPGQMPGSSAALIKRTRHAADGVGRFYPPEGLYEPAALTASGCLVPTTCYCKFYPKFQLHVVRSMSPSSVSREGRTASGTRSVRQRMASLPMTVQGSRHRKMN
jgi:hypothetical protein